MADQFISQEEPRFLCPHWALAFMLTFGLLNLAAVSDPIHPWPEQGLSLLLSFAISIPLFFPKTVLEHKYQVIFLTIGLIFSTIAMATIAFWALPYDLSVKILAIIAISAWQLRYYLHYNPWKTYRNLQKSHLEFKI